MYVHDVWLDDAALAKIVEDYAKETKVWEALKVGQILYECDGYDCFAHEIISVDVPKRIVVARDLSLESKPMKEHPYMRGLSLKPQPCM